MADGDRRPCSSRLQVGIPDRGATVGLMSGGQRQAIAVARAAAFASQVVILDEPTAALGVRESRRCSTSSSGCGTRAAPSS